MTLNIPYQLGSDYDFECLDVDRLTNFAERETYIYREWRDEHSPNLCGRGHDRPAMIISDGSMSWRVMGRLHREDAPSIIKLDGTKDWYDHGQWCLSPNLVYHSSMKTVIQEIHQSRKQRRLHRH